MTRFGVVSVLFRAWIRCNGNMAIANEKEETVSFQECIYTAVRPTTLTATSMCMASDLHGSNVATKH